MKILKFVIIRKITIFSLVFSLTQIGFGQDDFDLLKRTVENASYVLEGKVISKESFIDSRNGEILTSNNILVNKVIKGDDVETISIITKGGTVDGETISLSHGVKLAVDEYGIFILKEDFHLTMLDGSFGKIKRLYNDSKYEAYYEGTRQKYISWRKLREQIGDMSNNDLRIIPINSFVQLESDPEICVQIANIEPSISNLKLEFDLMIKSNIEGLQFAAKEIIMDYPIERLGANIVFNNKIAITKEIVTNDATYEIELLDVTNSRLKVDLKSGCSIGENYYILGTEFEKMVHVEIEVQSWGEIGTLFMENVGGESKYFLGNGGCVDLLDVCVQSQVGFLACDALATEVAPFAAGIGQILTITGDEFGLGILGEIEIPNPDDGGDTEVNVLALSDYIVDWDDNEIRINLSSIAPGDHPMGSGTWLINPDVTQQDILKCPVDIEIDYALINIKNNNDVDKMLGIAQDAAISPNGDYHWYLDLDINTDPILMQKGITFADVESIAEAAFCDWEMITGINFEYLGGISGAAIGGALQNDERSVLSFGSLNRPGQTQVSTANFVCDDIHFADRLTGADIQLNRDEDWFISAGTTGIENTGKMDMYSILMHEIGHALLFEHSMDLIENGSQDARIMYFGVAPEQIKRSIDPKTGAGFELLKTRSIDALAPGRCFVGRVLNTNPTGCTTPVQSVNNLDCRDILKSNIIHKGEMIVLEINSNNFGIFNIYSATGIKVHSSKETLDGSRSIKSSTFEAGIYFLQYECKNILKTEKFVIY